MKLMSICVTVLLFASCTRFTPPLFSFVRFAAPIKNTGLIATNLAAVYGRFATGPDFAFGNDVALRLCSEDGRRVYVVRCREKDPVYAIAVEPGRYRIAGFIATFMDHRPVGHRNFPVSDFFQVRPASATYIGDFSAYARTTPMVQQWGVSNVTNNFVPTTRDYKFKYAQMASLPIFSVFTPTKEPQSRRDKLAWLYY